MISLSFFPHFGQLGGIPSSLSIFFLNVFIAVHGIVVQIQEDRPMDYKSDLLL